MIKDRGTIKWTSLMLPEHVQLLKQLWEEEEQQNEPILDEQMKEIIARKLINSYKYGTNIHMKLYEDGQFYMYKGIVTCIRKHSKTVILNDEKKVAIEQIISIDRKSVV